MQIEATPISDVKIVTPRKFADHRGFFSETFNAAAMAAAGLPVDFVQDNHSLSAARGTIRGLHFQSPPFAQHKLVRVVRGKIFDVAVDLRRSSPTFGKYVTVELSAENWKQLFIPVGFAHGFCTLEANTEVIYKVTQHFAPASDHGIAWDDPTIGIAWPVGAGLATVSDKDKTFPVLGHSPHLFA